MGIIVRCLAAVTAFLSGVTASGMDAFSESAETVSDTDQKIRDCRNADSRNGDSTYGFDLQCHGRTLKITVKTNPTTGFDWHFRNYDQQRLKSGGASYRSLDPRAKGAPSVATYTAEVLGSGNVSFDFWYMRNWKGGGIGSGYRFVLSSDSDGNITGYTIVPLKREDWIDEEED